MSTSALSPVSRHIKSRVASAKQIDFTDDFKRPLKPKWQADCPRDVYLESVSPAFPPSLCLSRTVFPPFSSPPPQCTFLGWFSRSSRSRASTRKTEKVEGLSELFLAGSTSSRAPVASISPCRPLRGRNRVITWAKPSAAEPECRREKFTARFSPR